MALAEKVAFKGWPNCARLANGQIELIITLDVGPRVARLGFIGEDNLMAEYAAMQGKTGGDEWRIYGGHRLWHAPEDPVRTYEPDNGPVKLEEHPGFVRVIPAVEKTTGIAKEIDFSLDASANHVHVVHRLRNHNLWAVELAPWALSVMAPGGTCFVPLPPRGSHGDSLLPANMMSFWPYTNMADPRWSWGYKWVMLRQDTAATTPQKVGVQTPDGWAAYARQGFLFVKKFGYQPDATYPDMGCNFETYTNNEMIEVESLGPTVKLAPGAAVEHVEEWYLFKGVPQPASEADIERDILPVVKGVIG